MNFAQKVHWTNITLHKKAKQRKLKQNAESKLHMAICTKQITYTKLNKENKKKINKLILQSKLFKLAEANWTKLITRHRAKYSKAKIKKKIAENNRHIR